MVGSGWDVQKIWSGRLTGRVFICGESVQTGTGVDADGLRGIFHSFTGPGRAGDPIILPLLRSNSYYILVKNYETSMILIIILAFIETKSLSFIRGFTA